MTQEKNDGNNESKAAVNPLQQRGFQNPLLLGSGSFTRKLILKQMGVTYHLMVRSIDEKSLGDRSEGSDPRSLVQLLAKAKADHLIQGIMEVNYPNEVISKSTSTSTVIPEEVNSLTLPVVSSTYEEGWILLTADQVVTHQNKILEKPTSIKEAQQFCHGYAESPPSTVGAVVLTHIPSLIQVKGVDTATIHFTNKVAERNDDGKDLIEILVDQGEPILSCAGGLMVEHPLTKRCIDRMEGTEESVMGLSIELVLQLLDELQMKLEEKELMK